MKPTITQSIVASDGEAALKTTRNKAYRSLIMVSRNMSYIL